MRMQTAFYTDVGGREGNEDSVKIQAQDKAVLAVVADGLGGHGGGAIASGKVINTVCEGWSGYADPDEMKLLGRRAHSAVQEQQTAMCAMKSTLVAVSICGDTAAWVHAGDSRLYRFYNGKLEFQTKDHSASQLAVMLGDITPDEIRFHEDRSRVLRALGQDGDLQMDTGTAELKDGRYAFLLCTDGFWEYVLEAEMEADLATASDPEDWLKKMRSRLLQRIPEDNDNNTAAAVFYDRA